jgi:hypothetical protein
VDWQQLLHDKRVLYVGGVGAAVGAYALWQRKRSGANSSSGPGNPAVGSGGAGTLDTSGTDSAAWVGQFSDQMGTQLQQFLQQLTGALSNLPPPAVPGSPAPAPTPTFNGGTPITNPAAHTRVNVVPFTRANPPWASTLSGIAAHEHTTVGALLRLNPGISNPNIIHPGQQITVN